MSSIRFWLPALLGALLVLVAALLWRSGGGRGEYAGRGAGSPVAAADAVPDDADDRGDPAAARRGLQRDTATPAVAPEPDPGVDEVQEAPTVRGVALDVEGAPVAGLDVLRARGGGVLATTDGAGRFAFELPEGEAAFDLVARSEAYAPVRESAVDRFSFEREHVLVVARAVRLAGRTVDEAGRGLEGVAVRVRVPDTLLNAVARPLDMTRRVEPRTTSDATGAFDLGVVAAVPGARIEGTLDGHVPARVDVPGIARDDLVLELLQPAAAAEPRVLGRVLLPGGAPAVGAEVRYGSLDARTAADGTFELPANDWVLEESPLVAALAGYQPAVLHGFGAQLRAARPGAPDPVTLVLGDDALALAGRVVDAKSGAGLPGWTVMLGEGVEVSAGRVPPILAEGMAGGRWRTRTADDGTFRLTGLVDREYLVRAYHPDTLLSVSAILPAGAEDALLEVGHDLAHSSIAGVVVSRGGRPVPDAEVSLGLITWRSGGAQSWDSTTPVRTDAQGRFVLRDAPKSDVFLGVGGKHVVPVTVDLEPGYDPDDVRVEVALRCHFQVEVAGGDTDGLAVEVRDAAGETLTIHGFHASGSWGSARKPLEEGRLGVHAVSEDGRTIALLRGREELLSEPLALTPGEVAQVRLELPR